MILSFQPVVSPAKPSPAGAVENAQLFVEPQTNYRPSTTRQQLTNSRAKLQEQPAHWPKSNNRPSTNTTRQQPTNQPATLPRQPTHRPKTDNRPFTTDHSHPDQVTRFSPSTSPVEVQQTPETDIDNSSVSDFVVHELPTGQTEEGELSDLDQGVSVTNQASTEEQNYRETMHGVRSYMGWTHILDIDATMSSAEDSPFAAPTASW